MPIDDAPLPDYVARFYGYDNDAGKGGSRAWRRAGALSLQEIEHRPQLWASRPRCALEDVDIFQGSLE